MAALPSTEQMAATLRRSPLLSGFGDGALQRLAGLLQPAAYDAGDRVVAEDEHERAMFFCLSGRARVERGGMELQTIEPGEHFGELALVADLPRAATVSARTRLVLGRLDHAAYLELHQVDPALGRELLERITGDTARRLSDVTDSVRHLMRERSTPRRRLLDVRVMGRARSVHPGTPVGQLLPREIDGHWVVAGLLDHKPVALSWGISASCAVEPLTTAHWEGQRIYRHSLALLMLEAAARQDPDARVILGHSVGFAQRVLLQCPDEARLGELARELAPEMKRIAADALPLIEEWWTVDEAREFFRDRGERNVDALLSTWREPAVPLVSFGKALCLRLGPLVPDAGRLSGFSIEQDAGGLLLLYGRHVSTREVPRDTLHPVSVPPPSMPPESRVAEARAVAQQTASMIGTQQPWLGVLAIDSVGAFNRTCIDGSVPELIRVNEGFHEKAIGQIADTIAERHPRVRIACIAGPSSSGKSTFIKRLRVQLKVNGITPVDLSLDDYYVDREATPRDARGELDFEALEALDLPLLAEHLAQLLRGETVRLPHYDFVRGKSRRDGREVTLGPEHILLVEGLHGLNPRVLGDTPEDVAFRIFICPLGVLPFDRLSRVHASDLRLLRRIIRDRHHRGISAADNILRWPSVRRGERRHIFPYQQEADAVFDSSLVYELSVLRVYAERYLLEVPHDSPAYATAFRLLQLLDRFVAIYPDHVPPTSLIREFIGESGFEY
ncbi:MAG: cyclic nucleotide-binding domain-containing protein [Myxococcales bacterium]|jgi:uridine kinase